MLSEFINPIKFELCVNTYEGFLIFISIFCFLFLPRYIKAAGFDPNFIISDEEYLDSTSMSLPRSQQFLESKRQLPGHLPLP